MNRISLETIKSCILGHAVGDALGVQNSDNTAPYRRGFSLDGSNISRESFSGWASCRCFFILILSSLCFLFIETEEIFGVCLWIISSCNSFCVSW